MLSHAIPARARDGMFHGGRTPDRSR
jgi:hypothetical protein